MPVPATSSGRCTGTPGPTRPVKLLVPEPAGGQFDLFVANPFAPVNNLIAEDPSAERVFYDAPRNIGSPEYIEYRTGDSIRSMNVSLRRDF